MTAQIRRQDMIEGELCILVEIRVPNAQTEPEALAEAITLLQDRARTCVLENIVAGKLTPRENEIVAAIAEGKYVKEVARELGITENTVGTHIKNIRLKLGMHSRTKLANLLKVKR